MEALIRKFKYILLFIGIIFHNHCSSQIDENINIICSYGLEEKSTIDKIEQILENPKNVVIILDEYYLYLKNILDGTVTFWDGEDKLCESVINPLLNKENLISFKFRSSPFFPSYLLLKLDSIKLNKVRSEEHTSELQSRPHLVCRLLLEKKKKKKKKYKKHKNKKKTKKKKQTNQVKNTTSIETTHAVNSDTHKTDTRHTDTNIDYTNM